MATSPLPPLGPKRGQKCYVTPTFSGVPKQGDKIKSGYLTASFSGAQKGANATSPLHSRGPQTKGDTIRSGYLTPSFSGGQKRADILRYTNILGVPK